MFGRALLGKGMIPKRQFTYNEPTGCPRCFFSHFPAHHSSATVALFILHHRFDGVSTAVCFFDARRREGVLRAILKRIV